MIFLDKLRALGLEYLRSCSLHFPRNFPISFKPKVAIAKFVWKKQKKSGIMKSGLDAMPLFLLDDLLKKSKVNKEGLSEHLKLK